MSTISAGTTTPTALSLSGDTTGALTFQVNGTTTAATITSAGNVGIGTASPAVQVHATGVGRFSQLQLPNNAGTYTSGSAGFHLFGFSDNALYFNWFDNGAIVFRNNGTSERMRIAADGSVGIGTNNPGDKLDVVGGNIRIASGNTVRWVDAGNIRASIEGNSSSNAIFSTAGSERMRIDSSGNVGIGTSTASFRVTNNFDAPAAWGNNTNNFIEMWQNQGTNALGVAMGDDSLVSLTTNNGYSLLFATSGTERMRIDASSGNVGIGTSSPGAKLTVSGGSSTFAHINGGNSNTDPIFASVNNATVASADYGWLWFNNATNGNLDLYRRAGSTTNTHVASFVRASGNMLLGTSAGLGEGARLDIITADNEADVTTWRYNNATAGKYWRWLIDSNSRLYCLNQSGAGVYIDDGSTSWSAYSDERAKTDLKPIEDSVNKVCQLRAVTGRYKTDEEGTSRSFLIAQDVQKVFPEAVSDVNPDELGLRYSEMVPLLVAAVKELKAENDALKARIEALETK